LKANRRDQAGADFRKALAIRPGGTEALIGLGLVLVDRQPKVAIPYLEKGLARAPAHARAHAALGSAYDSVDRKTEAIQEYQKYLEIDPEGELAPEIRELLARTKP